MTLRRRRVSLSEITTIPEPDMTTAAITTTSTTGNTDNPLHSRFKDAPWYPKGDVYIFIGGAGGIGSWLTLMLARAGFKLIVYDFDMLEAHNLGGQLYSRGDISKSKVIALRNMVYLYTNNGIDIKNEPINEDTPTNNYAISAFDNMAARKIMFNKWKTIFSDNDSSNNALFIDGRLTAEQMQIFCIRGNDKDAIKEYETNHLFDDSEVEDAPCTMKQTSHAAAMIASHMTGFFTNHYTNIVEGDTTRAVPFQWQYFIPMDLVEVQTEF